MSEHREEEDSKRLASRRVAVAIRTAIDIGAYQVGAALPPLRQLATDYGVAVNTALAGVRLLTDEGYLTNKPNGGYYVRDRANQVDPEQDLRTLRAGLGELRTKVREASGGLEAVDAQISALFEVISRLESNSKQTD